MYRKSWNWISVVRTGKRSAASQAVSPGIQYRHAKRLESVRLARGNGSWNQSASPVAALKRVEEYYRLFPRAAKASRAQRVIARLPEFEL